MTSPTLRRLLLLALALLTSSADARTEPTCTTGTGGTSTLVIPQAQGSQAGLAEGDVLRVYTEDGLCVGETVWEKDAPAVLSLWRDDPVTSDADGAAAGAEVFLMVEREGVDVPTRLGLTVRPALANSTEAQVICCTYDPDAVWVASVHTVGAAGVAEVEQSGPGSWTPVALPTPLADPVVVAGPPSANGSDPATVRVRRVGPGSFEVQLDEWDYLDGSHVAEHVGWVALEAGARTLADGRWAEAGRAEGVGGAWAPVSFAAPFAGAPVVLVQPEGAGDGAVAARVRAVTASGFEVLVQREERWGGAPAPETVAWVAVEVPEASEFDGGVYGSMGVSYGVGRTADAVTHDPSSVPFAAPFGGAPAVLASIQTFDGSDPSGLRVAMASSGSFSVFVEEEASKDSEVRHTTEVVGWLALETGTLMGSATQQAAGAGAAQASAQLAAVKTADSSLPTEVAIDGVYPNPSRGAARIRYGLPTADQVSIEVFDALGRRVGILADRHQTEGWHEVRVDGAALPAGVYVVRLRAGQIATATPFTIAR